MTDQRSSSSGSAAVRQMMELIWPGALVAQAVYVAAKLGIAELLNDGPKSAQAIAAAIGAHAPSLQRLLHALTSVGVFTESPTLGRFRADSTHEHFCLTVAKADALARPRLLGASSSADHVCVNHGRRREGAAGAAEM